jgi:hypothetical protein
MIWSSSLFAVFQRLGGPPCLVFAAPLFFLSFPTFTFDLRLAVSLLDEPRDFDGGFLQLPSNGWDTARKVPGQRLSPLRG